MADRIKGITIEIGGETSKLQDSLKDVNKSLKDTQSQLKDVDKLLKLDPKNMELLAQKQELLGRATEQTADKLQKLRDAQKAMDDAGVDKMSDDYMKVEREIQECEQQQKKFTEEAKETDKTILKVGSGMQDVADKAKKASDATKGISTAAAAGLTGMAGLAVETGKIADDLNTMSKQSGFSTDTLQKMKYASDLIDVDMESVVGSAAKLKKNLDKNEDTLKALNVQIRDANGQYRDMESIFFDVIAGLSTIENEVERDKIAMDLFGKSADELAGYIDDGGQAYRELAAEAEAHGAIISQEDLDAANEFNDALDKLKATVGADLIKAGAAIGQALLPVLEKMATFITKVADAFANLSPVTQGIIMVILALVASLSPLLGLIATISTALPIITTVVGAISAPILGIVVAVAAVIAIIVILITHWNDLKTAAIALGQVIKEQWEKIKAAISEKIDNIKQKIDEIKQKFEDFKAKVKSIWETIKGILKGTLPTPKLKLPHIKISGSWSMKPPSAPKFSIDWYDKAMDDAYILNGATIFGAQGNSLLGGGESGSETIVGTDKLMDMMSQVVGNQNVTVVLQGDAAEVFRLVRSENTSFYKSNGYSPIVRGV